MKFRALKNNEIDVRVQQIKDTFVVLLLYKDARCDMNILDESVGAMDWKREHSRDNANCTVSIWDDKKSQWVGKEDTGTESNTEKEKGLASDSFKRACFNWGIGRELYTAPEIKIFTKNYSFIDKFTKYEVTHLVVTDGQITEISIDAIYNFGKSKTEVFNWKKANVKNIDKKEAEEIAKKQETESKNKGIELCLKHANNKRIKEELEKMSLDRIRAYYNELKGGK